MNISSVIVSTSSVNIDFVADQIKAIPGCEVHLKEGHSIIVTVEAENSIIESQLIKRVERISEVIAVKMVYAYSEDELNNEKENIEKQKDFPNWLNEDIDAKDIIYSGNLLKP